MKEMGPRAQVDGVTLGYSPRETRRWWRVPHRHSPHCRSVRELLPDYFYYLDENEKGHQLSMRAGEGVLEV